MLNEHTVIEFEGGPYSRDWNMRVPTCPHLADFSRGN